MSASCFSLYTRTIFSRRPWTTLGDLCTQTTSALHQWKFLTQPLMPFHYNPSRLWRSKIYGSTSQNDYRLAFEWVSVFIREISIELDLIESSVYNSPTLTVTLIENDVCQLGKAQWLTTTCRSIDFYVSVTIKCADESFCFRTYLSVRTSWQTVVKFVYTIFYRLVAMDEIKQIYNFEVKRSKVKVMTRSDMTRRCIEVSAMSVACQILSIVCGVSCGLTGRVHTLYNSLSWCTHTLINTLLVRRTASTLLSVNQVTLRWARLVLG